MEHQNSTLNTSTTSANLPSYACDCGFGVGTLVWTDKGQVPIEQLKVGDMVLSQDEVTGERAYKPITRTFVHHNQPICQLYYETEDIEAGGYTNDIVLMTANHPVWWLADEETKKGFWVEAGSLEKWDELLLANGARAFAAGWSEAYRWTKKPKHNWSKDFWFYDVWDDISVTPLMSEGNYLIREDNRIPFVEGYAEADAAEKIPYTTDVYTIEVTDFHTYFIGLFGLLVHNKDRIGNSSPPHLPQILSRADQAVVVQGDADEIANSAHCRLAI